jgi:hypothetical protein
MKRLFVLSAIVCLFVTTFVPSWAGSNLNSSRSNIYRDACKGKPDGTIVKVEGKNEKCPAPPEPKPEQSKTRSNSY